jgi:hypothetical protein
VRVREPSPRKEARLVGFAAGRPQRGPRDVDRLGDEIAELAAHLHAATYRLLVLLREFDERGGWGRGFASCAHWLSWRTGIAAGAAREKMRVAHALAKLPRISLAMKRGQLSYSKVRALTRIATPASERDLVELALNASAAQVERIVRGMRRCDRIEEAERERDRHEARFLRLWVDEDGSWVVRGRLDPEAGALLEKALAAAAAELQPTGEAGPGAHTPAQRRADALALLTALAVHGGAAAGSRRLARAHVVMHVEGDDAVLDNGARVPAETARRLLCDADRVTMRHDAAGGSVLNVGRRTRAVPSAVRRALEHRDRTCRFPGCGNRFCDAHHVRHWADGGETRLDNLVLLCRSHHRAVHENGFTVQPDGGGRFAFFDPHDLRLPDAPKLLVRTPSPWLQLQEGQKALRICAWTAAPRGGGGRLDLDWVIRALRRRRRS